MFLAATLAGSILLTRPALGSFELPCVDDIWVYPHSFDQADASLRAWGSGGRSVPDGKEAGSISWSCLKFDVSSLPEDAKISSAKLIIFFPAVPAFTNEQAKAAPLEVRSVSLDFEEETFKFGFAEKVFPKAGDEGLFGTGSPDLTDNADAPHRFEIDLMKGKADFAKALTEARKSQNKQVALALTSKIDPEEAGDGGVYKLFSRNAEKAVRPVLVIDAGN